MMTEADIDGLESVPTLIDKRGSIGTEISEMTTATFGAEIVQATKREFLRRFNTLQATKKQTITPKECEGMLFEIEAEQRKKFNDRRSSTVQYLLQTSRKLEAIGTPQHPYSSSPSKLELKEKKSGKQRRRQPLGDSSRTIKASNVGEEKKSANSRNTKYENKKVGDVVHVSLSLDPSKIREEKPEEEVSTPLSDEKNNMDTIIHLKLQLANLQGTVDTLTAKVHNQDIENRRLQEELDESLSLNVTQLYGNTQDAQQQELEIKNRELENENKVLWDKVLRIQNQLDYITKHKEECKVVDSGRSENTSKTASISITDSL